jgi:DNA-binding response OmpR family regulator
MSCSAPLTGKRVLIVEDVQDSAEMLKLVLEDIGCHARCVGTGEEALKAFALDPVNKAADFIPDLALIDLRLPDMSGVELIERLRARASKIPPTVVITADSQFALNTAAGKMGAVGVRKPIDFDELFMAIAVVMNTQTTS